MLDAEGEAAVSYDCLSRFIARVEKHSKHELDLLLVHLQQERYVLLDNDVEDVLDLVDGTIDYVERRRDEIVS